MYGKDDLWPIACPKCRHEFTEKIERLEAGEKSRCPSCRLNVVHRREQFLLVVAQARAGTFNPWREMISIERQV
jgi:hypothetical protein